MAPVLRTLAWIFGLSAVLWTSAAGAQSPPDAVNDALQAELSGDFQRALPQARATPPPAPASTRTGRGTAPRRIRNRPAATPAPASNGGGAALLNWMMWGVGFIVLVAAVVLILTTLRDGRRRRIEVDQGTSKELPVGDAAGASAPIAVGTGPKLEADVLAEQGRFADAIHCLLLRTLSELSVHQAAPLPPAATSRVLLSQSRLSAAAARAFGVLVRATELTRFGGRSATADHYATCVDHFEQFRRSLSA